MFGTIRCTQSLPRARSALFIHIANLVSYPIAQKRIHGADATSDRFVPELQFVLKAAPLEFRRDDSSIKLNLVCRQSRASCKCFLCGGNKFLQGFSSRQAMLLHEGLRHAMLRSSLCCALEVIWCHIP